MFLYKLFGVIDISASSILSFFLGVFIGVELIILIYAILVLLSLGNKKYITKTETDTLTEAQAKEMIAKAQAALKDKTLRGDKSKGEHFKEVCGDMVYGIATSFFPNSKYPLFELTVDETVELIGYVQKRLNEVLDKRALRILRRLKVSFVVKITRETMTVVNSKVFHVAKEVEKTTSKLSWIDPRKWLTKGFSATGLAIVVNKLYSVSLSIVGEEAYKIYSKAVLNKEAEFDSEVEQVSEELDNELMESKKQEMEEYKKELKKIENHPDSKKEAKSLPEPEELTVSNSGYKFKTKNVTPKELKYSMESIFDVSMKMKQKESQNEEKEAN